jgi:hypothetical protein
MAALAALPDLNIGVRRTHRQVADVASTTAEHTDRRIPSGTDRDDDYRRLGQLIFRPENWSVTYIVRIVVNRSMAHYEAEFLTIEWDDSIEAVIMNWTGFAESDEYREGLNEGLELVKRHDTENWLADLREMKTVSQADQEWTQDDWHPRAFETPLSNMAIVQPESVVTEMSVEDLVQEIGEQITMKTFDNRADARAWLEEQ